ncbi:MAG: ABC transporter substrate-binding protein, partial [Flavobacteriales bacterium]
MSTIPDNRKVFTYNESNGISSLDPAFARNLENMWAVNQLFDGLVELDANLKVEPLIASSWDIQDSGLTYVFHLRDDVFFHPSIAFGEDSTRQVVASDFQYSFNRIVNPATASSGKWVFDLVDFENSNGFESPNDSTFVIHLKQAFSPFLGMLAMQYCNVVPAEAIDYYGEDFRENPIGTGPFKMAFWMENVALVYHKNTKFFQSDT